MLMFIRLTVSLLSDYCHENKNNILLQAITGCNLPNVKMHKVGRYIRWTEIGMWLGINPEKNYKN